MRRDSRGDRSTEGEHCKRHYETEATSGRLDPDQRSGSVLSEVDMVGALKCIDAACGWTKQTATDEDTESSEED